MSGVPQKIWSQDKPETEASDCAISATRLRGALWGALVGDALGVPYEFHPPAELPASVQIEMQPPPGFARAHVGVPPGTWSDDGAHLLCLAQALIEAGDRPFYAALASLLVEWKDQGRLAVDGKVFDVGGATLSAIHRLRQRQDDGRSAGCIDEHCNGNGAWMRVLPLALWCGDESRLVEQAMQQSRITHGHPVSQLCCALYCLWVRRCLAQTPELAWQAALKRMDAYIAPALTAQWRRLREELEQAPGGTGYVVDCLRSARWALQAEDFETIARRAISLGYDADTTACVACGIAGLVYGEEAIPLRWRQAMRGGELAEPLIQAFVARAGRHG